MGGIRKDVPADQKMEGKSAGNPVLLMVKIYIFKYILKYVYFKNEVILLNAHQQE